MKSTLHSEIGWVKRPRFRVPTLEALGERQLAVVFLAPSLLLLTIIVGWPVIYSFFLSFHEVMVIGGSMTYKAVGLQHYLSLAHDPRFLQALQQTVLFTTLRVSGVMGLGLLVALVLDQSLRGVGFLKRLFLIPWALSYVVNALMWGWIFHGNYGVMNALLKKLQLIDEYQIWLADSQQAMLVIIFASVWKATPFASLVLLAALKGVPRELKDAAKVDGAGAVDRFVHIILPSIRPVILVLLVVETMWALKTFDLIWVLTKGGPADSTLILNVFAYQQAFQFFSFGYGSAAAYVITGLTFVLTLTYFVLLGRLED